jgi:uncharacterized membrane protein
MSQGRLEVFRAGVVAILITITVPEPKVLEDALEIAERAEV